MYSCIKMLHIGKIYKRASTLQSYEALIKFSTKPDVQEADTVANPDVEPIPVGKLPKPYLKSNLLTRRNLRFDKNQDEFFQHQSFMPHEGKDWTAVWPAPAPFKPYEVPLPIHMGVKAKKCVKPDKFSSLELLKVQNFLHLTPPAVEQHCKVLKQFCTKFPDDLDSDIACEMEFPVTKHTVDYVGASNSPRNSKARNVTKQIRLVHLGLNLQAREKITKLLEWRYNDDTDVATIQSKRCPVRKQNSDFLDYVFTALYFESWKVEEWEKPENACDDDFYVWENSESYKNLRKIVERRADVSKETMLSDIAEVRDYRSAVVDVKQDLIRAKRLEKQRLKQKAIEQQKQGNVLIAKSSPQRMEIIDSYKESVLNLLNLQKVGDAKHC
uniref:28S ribosomal protein S35, mitochondrial-like n=1 Tax=Phallusia mammillata TaxID=59560 RepID=A0A6F9DLV6_9ASCI|nr:28S ribosomal protein S35, mitochondrial-like [Phallusia mammillata]